MSLSPRAQAGLIVAGFVVTLTAAAVQRRDLVPPIAPPPTPAVKHQLYVFSESNCPYCAKLDAELSRPECQAALAAFAVVQVHDELVRAWAWRVRTYPTLVVTDAGGTELSRHEGYLSAAALAAWLDGFR